jgi:hypothetical protein
MEGRAPIGTSLSELPSIISNLTRPFHSPSPNASQVKLQEFRLKLTLQLSPQDPIFGGQVFIAQKQFPVHGPGDVRQDACPLHKFAPSAHRSAIGAIDAHKMVRTIQAMWLRDSQSAYNIIPTTIAEGPAIPST